MTAETEAQAPAAVRVVLVGPRGGANVGSVCRAIENTGGGELAIVAGAFEEEDARRMSVHANGLLEGAIRTATFGEAVAGCGLVVGTTVRDGPYRERAREVRELAGDVWQWQSSRGSGARVALVFGREDSGLSNDEIAACHWLTRIPTSARYPSLNLAQAALIVLYELMQVRASDSPGLGVPGQGMDDGAAEVADARQVDGMFEDLGEAMDQIGFLGEKDGPHVQRVVRSMLGRSVLDAREVRILRGLARQIRWFANGGREVLEDKRRRGQKPR
ncbi:MAG: tRNA/rRNA methyltransferase [Hyphomicrobiaceae bacterium]